MGQKKLLRFEAIKAFPNVLQYPANIAGLWKNHFSNENAITIELACGRGEYTVALAKLHPDRNFIGVDLKGNRLYIGAKISLEQQITNAAFLRTQIDKINTYFIMGEVAEIWITFPDPQLRNSKSWKRLTHPHFLRLYQQILSENGYIHLKTDSPELYEFTKLVINLYGLILHEENDHVHLHLNGHKELKIRTHYESLDIAGTNKVHYLKFSLPAGPLAEIDELLQERIKAYD
ncbi:MAG: tRNA (guanosine(46)-N7)-methyltransferase TrmB [Chitinophagaceae bacterium]